MRDRRSDQIDVDDDDDDAWVSEFRHFGSRPSREHGYDRSRTGSLDLPLRVEPRLRFHPARPIRSSHPSPTSPPLPLQVSTTRGEPAPEMPSFEAWPSYADKYAPLEDVKKAEVHFRASKAKVLRSLGASSYRNGSQFAMVWVSPAGEVDAYASVALQPKLQLWLGKRVQADAQDAVKQWRTDRDLRYRSGERDATTDAKAAPEYSGVYGTEGAIFRPDDDDDNDDDDDDDDMMGDRDDGGDCDARKPVASTSARPRSAEPVLAASSTTRHRSTRSINDARQQHTSPALSSHSATTSPNLAAASSNLVARQQHKPVKAAPMTREDLDHWFSTKISNLSHKTDKIVCRSWIKVIDPHKQTKFPYQKGEEAKPSWWPRNIRHKEPDHLGKQGQFSHPFRRVGRPSR